MSYRPITDVWILARSKVKYFGAYPAGFLQRARDLLTVPVDEQVLHVCSGRVRDYPYSGFGVGDVTMELDASLDPDIYADASVAGAYKAAKEKFRGIRGVLADPPYSEAFAEKYAPGATALPSPDKIIEYSLRYVLPIGGRVGILGLTWPRYPKSISRQIAVVAVYVGNGNLGRTFAVYERTR